MLWKKGDKNGLLGKGLLSLIIKPQSRGCGFIIREYKSRSTIGIPAYGIRWIRMYSKHIIKYFRRK